MVSSFTTNKHLEKPAHGDDVDTWELPVNGNSDSIDACFGGVTLLTATSGSVVLSVTQYRAPILKISGSLIGGLSYAFPSGVGGWWTYDTTGLTLAGHPCTLQSGGGGTSVSLAGSTTGIIYCDGTNVKSAIPTTTTPPGGSSGQVQYNLGGIFAGSSNLTFNGTTLAAAAMTLGTPLGIAQGGIGANSLPQNAALIGNSSGSIQGVAPGTAGNVLTSNGAVWVSAASPGVVSFNGRTGAVTLTTGDVTSVQPTAFGALGTYVTGLYSPGDNPTIGGTYAGSVIVNPSLGSMGLSGTWRQMGLSAFANGGADPPTYAAGLWLRIA